MNSLKIPIILVKNKIDLKNEREILKDEYKLISLADKFKWPFIEVSAKMNTNISQVQISINIIKKL
jgi:GTPase SAR1 family protein